jgi:hypothetical protein
VALGAASSLFSFLIWNVSTAGTGIWNVNTAGTGVGAGWLCLTVRFLNALFWVSPFQCSLHAMALRPGKYDVINAHLFPNKACVAMR